MSKYLILLFSPILLLIRAFKKFRLKQSQNYFWLYCIYFGFSFIYENPIYGEFSSDSATYASQLISSYNNNISFEDFFLNLYNIEGGSVDIIQPFITWLISNLTSDPKYLFTVFSVIFGFFYSRNLWTAYSTIENKLTPFLFLLIIYVASITPIWFINGFRMWAGSHVFVFGILNYFLKSTKQGLFYIGLSIFFHFSFLFPVISFFIWYILPKKVDLYFVGFLITTFVYQIDISGAKQLMQYLPNFLENRLLFYVNDDYVHLLSSSSDSFSFHVKATRILNNIYTFFCVFILYINKNQIIKTNKALFTLFTFSLLFGSFANILAILPSGGRFLTVFNFLFYLIFLIHFGNKSILLRKNIFYYISNFSLILLIIFNIRVGLDFIGLNTIFGNPIFSLFITEQLSIMSVIKSLL